MRNNWSIVIHEVTQTTAAIWFGTLKSDMRKYELFELHVHETKSMGAGTESSAHLKTIEIDGRKLKKPFKGSGQRFYGVEFLQGLKPGCCYKVELHRPSQDIGLPSFIDARQLSFGSFRTLPEKLTTKDFAKPLVVMLGSCFYPDDDDFAVGQAYEALLASGKEEEKPDIKFLTGDQVYLDIGLDSLSPVYQEVQERIAEDYALSWLRLRRMLRHGATWMLADDHEFWNNYPHTTGKNPYLWMLHANRTIKEIWEKSALDGVKNVQRILPLRQIDISDQISFLLADTRTQRTEYNKSKPSENRFMSETDLSKLERWITTLTCPGVLVLSQPLIVKPGGEVDRNLADYHEQYSRVLEALSKCAHDVLVLSGDVHYGRISNISLGNSGRTLHEIIASPMSNLTGIDGRFAASASKKIKTFPPIKSEGIPKQNVNYPEHFWRVSSQRTGGIFGIGDYTKTKEHFSTLAFSLNPDGQVIVDVKTWLLKEKSRNGKPREQFKTPNEVYSIKLQ
tara:strand:- start:2979 stop:4502 length:1524 start_codon:yes stop_codon:yes gene_type:complete